MKAKEKAPEERADVRIDKWLWAARFFKGRDLAARACELGRVDSNGQRAKPARTVRLGDRLDVKTEGGQFEVEVLGLSDTRGPAAEAQALYRETEESKQRRAREGEARRTLGPDIGGGGRPDSRDRNARERFRGKG